MRSPDVYMVPRDDGLIDVGASMEEEGFNGKATVGAQLDLLYQLAAVPRDLRTGCD